MNGEVQLIVGATAKELQLITIQPVNGTDLSNYPLPCGLWVSYPGNEHLWTIGSVIYIVTTSDPATWTVLGTITIVSVDPITQSFTYTTDFTPDPDTIYTTAFYTNAVMSSQAYLDLYANESISQNWKFQDLNNFSAQGAFSREFRIPFSDTNQQALGALFDVNVDAGASNYFHYKLPAEIRVDTLPLATGYLRVRKVYKQKGIISEVEVAFYAETPDLVRNIGEKKLKDIAALDTLNENIGYATVTAGNANRIWTLCDRGQRWSEGNEVGTRSVMNTSYPVYASDLTPAISWKWLFNRIVEEAGFELVAGTLDSIMQDYWMPWCNTQSLNTSATGNQFLFTAQTSSAFTNPDGAFNQFLADTVVFDNNGDYNAGTYTYTAPAAGQFTFGVLLHTYALIANGIQVATSINGATPIVNAEIFVPTNNNDVSTTFVLTLNAGDTVTFYLLEYSPTVTIGNNSYLSLIATNLYFNTDMLYANNAPDAKQIDFITDVIKMHNCAIVADRAVSNKVYIVPQTSYLGSGNQLDWTSKLDIDKDIVMYSAVELQKGKFQFTYTDGQDYLSQQYKKVNRVYGDYQAVGYTVNPNTLPSDFAIGDQKIQLTTQSTPCAPINGTNKIIPQFINDSQQFVAPAMRCLYDAGTVNIVLFDDGGAGSTLTAVPVLNHYSAVNAAIDDYDLNWAPEVPPYQITGSPYNNLFNMYWRSYMNALYSPEARIMEASFALDLTDIYTFQFNDKVWVQDSWWRILEINDYKIGMNESTQVKLLKFLDNVEDCTATPSSVAYSGNVQFVDADGNPTDPTQDCCQRYGYNWNESNGTCWAFVPPTEKPTSGISGKPTSPAVIRNAVENRAITGSVLNGSNVVVAVGNRNMVAVGTDMQLDAAVDGSNLLGKNTYTKLPGLHIGGGWKNGISTSGEIGWAQSGSVSLHYKDSWSDAQWYDIPVEGKSGVHIDMLNDCLWSCLMNVTILDTYTNNFSVGQYVFGLQKLSGSANDTGVTTLVETNGTPYIFNFAFDTTTNPAQHRLRLQITGIGVSPVTFIVTASLQYQQNISA